MKRFRLVAFALGLLFLVVGSASAILPAAVAGWLLTANNLMVADLTIGISGALAGFMWYECGFSFTTCKSSTPTDTGTTYAKAPVKALLRPTDSRMNPDPTKFDPDPTNQDVKPKASIPSPDKPKTTMPSTYTAVLDTYGVPYEGLFAESSSTSNTYRRIKTQAFTSTPPTTLDGMSRAYSRYVNATLYHGVYEQILTLTCPPGYTGPSSGACTLSVPADVKKPTTTPCEVLYKNGSFSFDAANPNCSGAATEIASTSSSLAKTSTSTTGEKERWSVEAVAGGGLKVCQDKGLGSTKVCATTGPYDSGQNGYPVQSTSSSPGTDLSGSGGGTTTTDPTSPGTGTGTGTGTSGTGTGDCSGYGCAKEDTQKSVLEGINKITAGATEQEIAALGFDPNAKAQALVTELQTHLKTPDDYNGIASHITNNLGLPPGGQCSNAAFSFVLFERPMTVDFAWLCAPLAPIVNWFFWALVTMAAISEVFYIMTGRGLNGSR